MTAWAGPYHGLDHGFAVDAAAAVRCYIDDSTKPPTLYVTHEFWALGCDIDLLPGALEAAIPGISSHVVYGDSARPETNAYLAKHGIPLVRSAEKWPGSVDDGIAFLRSFRIVVHPRCRHLIDELGRYSFKTDRLTGAVLPIPIDKHNHCIDALRYAVGPLIRNKASGGFINRAALLVEGEPLTPDPASRVRRILTTVAMSETDTAVGVIHWGYASHMAHPMRLLDYSLHELEEFLQVDCIAAMLDRAQLLRQEWNAVEGRTRLYCEQGEFCDALSLQFEEVFAAAMDAGIPPYDMVRVESKDLKTHDKAILAPQLDARMGDLRSDINGRQLAKLGECALSRQCVFRTTPANHLLGQLLGYRPGATGKQPQELVAAFALGMHLGRDAPSVSVISKAEAAAAPVPRPAHWLDHFRVDRE